MSRRTRLRLLHVNVVIYAAIVVLAGMYWDQLAWARVELRRYFAGEIGSPVERDLYRRAGGLIRERKQLEEARRMLDESLAIDPYGEAGFWLAQYHFASGNFPEALEQYESYLAIDPTMLEAYLKISAIHEREARPGHARSILERGLRSFEKLEQRWPAHPDPDVESKFNVKAARVHRRYEDSIDTLRREIRRLDSRASTLRLSRRDP